MNVFTASARVVADAELRTAGSSTVCSVRLAVDAGFGDKRTTLFLNASIWRNSEQLAAKLVKGTAVEVTGELSVRDYTSRDGKTGQSLDLSIERVGRIGAISAPALNPLPVQATLHDDQLDAIPF